MRSEGNDRVTLCTRDKRESKLAVPRAPKVSDLIGHSEEFLRRNTYTVLVNLKVEVIARGVSCKTDITDKFALIYPLTGLNSKACAVSIKGGVAGIVIDGNIVAPAVAPFVLIVGHNYSAGGSGIDRCAEACGHIKTLVAGVTLPACGNIAVSRARPLQVNSRRSFFRLRGRSRCRCWCWSRLRCGAVRIRCR